MAACCARDGGSSSGAHVLAPAGGGVRRSSLHGWRRSLTGALEVAGGRHSCAAETSAGAARTVCVRADFPLSNLAGAPGHAALALAALVALGCAERVTPAGPAPEGPRSPALVPRAHTPADATVGPISRPERVDDEAPRGRAPFALVELFTSEGCSSCPPADEVLRSIEASAAGRAVFALSFHVDYWNELGWPDPYSDPAYTRRQHEYARAFGARGVYTPQIVIDGSVEIVGSRGGEVARALERALERTASAAVDLRVEPGDGGGLVAVWSVDGASPGDVLHLALAEARTVSRVTRGENAGRTLAHVDVVRALVSRALEPPAGRSRIDVPRAMDRRGATVTAFVQRRDTMEVLGAARARVD